jgi:hypothetical protein
MTIFSKATSTSSLTQCNNNGKTETRHSQGGLAQDQKQAPHEAKASAAL